VERTSLFGWVKKDKREKNSASDDMDAIKHHTFYLLLVSYQDAVWRRITNRVGRWDVPDYIDPGEETPRYSTGRGEKILVLIFVPTSNSNDFNVLHRDKMPYCRRELMGTSLYAPESAQPFARNPVLDNIR
jgi:hypothetical protein